MLDVVLTGPPGLAPVLLSRVPSDFERVLMLSERGSFVLDGETSDYVMLCGRGGRACLREYQPELDWPEEDRERVRAECAGREHVILESSDPNWVRELLITLADVPGLEARTVGPGPRSVLGGDELVALLRSRPEVVLRGSRLV